MEKITPFLWFNKQAEEAINFYVSIFKNSSIKEIIYHKNAGPQLNETIFTASFTLDGQEFMAINGGDYFKFSPAVSFYVNCYTQEEVDSLWEKLSEGGEEMMCGWVKDRYGITWQIVPSMLSSILKGGDDEIKSKVMKATLEMKKLEINKLLNAVNKK